MIAKLLEDVGAVVSRTHLQNASDGSKVGPDDYFFGGGTLHQLLATVTTCRPWLAPLNPVGDVVSGAEHRAIRAERDELKARYALDRQLLANQNLKHGQVRAALITLDAIAYTPAGPVRLAQKTSLDAIAGRGMPKSTLERCLADLAHAGLIVKDSTLIRDPLTNEIVASQLAIAPGPALAVARNASVPDQKPSGGPRPKCERCGRENVKQVMVYKCLDCGHISRLDEPAAAVSYVDGASYTPPPDVVVALRKTRRNTPDSQTGNQLTAIADVSAAPQNEAISLTEDLSPQHEGAAAEAGTSVELPQQHTGTSHWDLRSPSRTVVSRHLDWSDWPSLQVTRRDNDEHHEHKGRTHVTQ